MRNLASDNFAGVHPAVLKALATYNEGHVYAYGHDPVTDLAKKKFQEYFGEHVDVYFVFNGTAANVLGLQAATKSYHTIFCSPLAHINVDECGAPENFLGCKLTPVNHIQGKLSPESIKPHLDHKGNQHHVQPRIISITQATEVGTVYRPEEIKALANYAHENGMYLHMDGARLSNAAAHLPISLKELTMAVGVDVLSFGGTKNGLMGAEAVVFFNPSLSQDFIFIRKQGMQLASKMRYLAAQFIALFSDDLWLKNASHANAMARYLEDRLTREIPQIPLIYPVEANGVFAQIPRDKIKTLQDQSFFWVWDQDEGIVRWMTSWDTQQEDIDNFIVLVKKYCF